MKIFVSYSSKTRSIVAELADDLIASGYTVWIDRELTGGRQWWADILQQIRDCDLFLFALTHQSLDSVPCQREYGYAYDLNKHILPAQMDDINISILPKALQKIQFVDYRQRDKIQYRTLIKALNTLPPLVPPPNQTIAEPPVPLSPLADLRERIDTPNLTIDLQKALAYDLTAACHDPSTQSDICALIELLLHREDDLNVRIHRDLTMLLRNKVKVWQPIKLRQASSISCVAFSSDSRYILSAGGNFMEKNSNHNIYLWDASTGHEIRQLIGHVDDVNSIAFSPNSRLIVSCAGGLLEEDGDYAIRLWDIKSGHEIRRFLGHVRPVQSIAFSPDGRFILSGGWDDTIRLWDINGGEIRQYFGHTSAVSSVVFSADGHFILSGSSDDSVRIWDVISGNEIRRVTHSGLISGVAFIANTNMAISTSHEDGIKLWDIFNGNEIQHFLKHSGVHCLAVSSNGRFFAGSIGSGKINLWETNSEDEIYQFSEDKDAIHSVAFSPDGRAILSGSHDGTVRIWPLDGII